MLPEMVRAKIHGVAVHATASFPGPKPNYSSPGPPAGAGWRCCSRSAGVVWRRDNEFFCRQDWKHNPLMHMHLFLLCCSSLCELRMPLLLLYFLFSSHAECLSCHTFCVLCCVICILPPLVELESDTLRLNNTASAVCAQSGKNILPHACWK